MLRLLVGAVAGAIAMFIIGFIFFATPVQRIGLQALDDNQAAAVQLSLARNLPGTGTFVVPDAGTRAQTGMYSKGPVAVIHSNMAGFAATDAAGIIEGFVHYLIVSALAAWFLYELGKYVRTFAERLKIAVIGILGAAILMRLSDPIWYHQDWRYAIFVFVADVVSLAAAALVILKLMPTTVADPVRADRTSEGV